jgi:1,4-dihydroxy-2-naphthoate octaprenyltransferase
VTAILHCNNLRDISEDQVVGKSSIAAAIGAQPSRWLYAALLAAAYASIAVAGVTGTVSAWALIGLAPAPFAFDAVRKLFVADDRPAMNRIMVRSAKVHGWTGVALAAGLMIASF